MDVKDVVIRTDLVDDGHLNGEPEKGTVLGDRHTSWYGIVELDGELSWQ